MKPIAVVGSSGRMTLCVKDLLIKKGMAFGLWAPDAPEEWKLESFENTVGVIDLSLPQVTPQVAIALEKHPVPWVCGTTGFASEEEKWKHFESISQKVPVVVDSNFSLGIELFCQAAERFAKALPDQTMVITDIHHQYKVDAPSGTALKIEKRVKQINPHQKLEHQAIRIAEIAGEHRLLLSWEKESLELTHRAFSREAFAEGALRALQWAQNQKPGLYSMKDVLS